jgi:hypothetical protein
MIFSSNFFAHFARIVFASFARNSLMIHGKNNTQPEAPYYANIFNYLLSNDLDGYQEMDEITLELVHDIDGFLGYESQKSAGRGSFISYWRDKESIAEWRIKRWYSYYHTMVVKVESARLRSP